MNGLGRVRLFLCRIALVPVFASFVVTVAAQDSSSGAPAQQTKTRFSDPGSMKKNASSKKVPARIPAVPAACGPDNVYYKVRLNDAPPVDTRPLPGERLFTLFMIRVVLRAWAIRRRGWRWMASGLGQIMATRIFPFR
jgi:hypothetical protein